VVFFAEADGTCPFMDWLSEPGTMPIKARDKCIVKIERLKERGHELRRPEADYLRDGIYELRVKLGHVNYRLLYFFHQGNAVVSHGCTKEEAVSEKEIDLAVNRSAMFAQDQRKHTYLE
jgi:phage-related protein